MHDWLEEWESTVGERSNPDSFVCSQCITDPDLWAAVEQAQELTACTFCCRTGSCVTFCDLETVIAEVVGETYICFEESGAYHEEGKTSERLEDIQVIVEELLLNAVTNDVRAPLVHFVAGQNAVAYGFVRTRDLWATLYDFHESEWLDFLRRVRTGNPLGAAEVLISALDPKYLKLFDDVTDIARVQGSFKNAQPTLWRCRAAPASANYSKAQDIGTAPLGKASAGRLNAEGHSCFYGSTTKRGAVIESAKHGGNHAELWVGQFRPSREVYHLDVMEVPAEPGPFARGAADARDAIKFLAKFSKTISQPNDPTDKQHYVPTQIFTAYLLARADGPEAIKFASSVDPTSENWILFVDRAHCADERPLARDELYLVLESGTIEFLIAGNFLDKHA